MKVSLALLTATLLSAVGLSQASAQQIRIGTVDMKQVFESFYKTKEADQRFNEARNSAKKELEERMESYKKMADEVQKLNEEIDRPELSKDGKETKTEQRTKKVNELKVLQREMQEFGSVREKQLQDQMLRMRGDILKEINEIVAEKVRSAQYDLVLDKSGPSQNGVPVVLHASPNYDFTKEVVTALNKNKGTDNTPAAEAAPAKPAPTTPAATPRKANR